MDSHIKNARLLSNLLDNKFSILGFKFGIDPLVGLIPFFGDVIGFVLSSYIIWIGHNLNLPAKEIGKMWRNVIFDLVLGSVPFIGDISDFFYKASRKNLLILEKHLKTRIIEGEIVG